MHVAIIGMGALGRVYGARLVAYAGASVTFVVRPARAAAPAAPVQITRIDGDGAKNELASPALDITVPAHADIVLVCVRVEQLDDALGARGEGHLIRTWTRSS